MLKVHQDIIISNLKVLVDETNVQTLVPELLNKNVFNKRMISRILNPSHTPKRQATNLYVEILKRGPEAFSKLRDALELTNHRRLAEILNTMDSEGSYQIERNLTLNSNLSNSDIETNTDGPSQSLFMNSRTSKSQVLINPQQGTSESSCFSDVNRERARDPKNKVFHPPLYKTQLNDDVLTLAGNLTPEDKIEYAFNENEPVHVQLATHWQVRAPDKPQMYKMDSNPRGLALLVNNKKFADEVIFPYRWGADNDEVRFTKLLEQLHFKVECHHNKTKKDMEEIVKNFSQKNELNNVDCVWVTFMSHGQEGDSSEDSEIVGVDGIGYKTQEIVSCFFNDYCKALINKPKLFFFQGCRGDLTDPGVLLGKSYGSWNNRIMTDGRRMNNVGVDIKIRTQSDIFIVYPSPPGIMANRDYITGAWFIQTVVDVFSQYACNTHLDDLIKMVDQRIKRLNNLITVNFQAVTTKTIGWNKHLYFNPGLFRNKASLTGETITEETPGPFTEPDGGMDVVDESSTKSAKHPNDVTYGRLKAEEDEEDSDHERKYDCFNFTSCRMS